VEETKASVRQDLLKYGKTEKEADDYIRDSEWLNQPAWPQEQV
jgi:hypothetical protein